VYALTALQVEADKGYIAEPLACTNQSCQAKNSMRIMHNRSGFADKQIIRIQEAPEHIPEGETPHTQSMCTWDTLVDVAKPGDRVEVTGIFRATSVRTNPRHRTLRAIYKTFVDIVHIKKLDSSSRLKPDEERNDPTDRHSHNVSFDEDDELAGDEDQKNAELRALALRPNLYNQLATALAPSVWELDDVKKGVLLQLMGATNKQLNDDEAGPGVAASKKRGEINVLLVGDPGTSKSQLLKYVHKVAPRGIYTSGKGSSAVGLTAYVTRDPETNEFVLESGALVLSDRGVCCIDEFDKMSEGARSILHEAMEQGTVSVAKAGIICSLNSRTSVLASANPIDSKYDPKRSVVDNINLGPTLLSRFDLIYLILDKPDERTDRQLARHLVSLYQWDHQPAPAAISQATLMSYISLARKEVHPKLSDGAARDLMNAYVDMRRLGASKRVITATPRQLESLIRLSEAHARMRLSPAVESSDVQEAVRLMKVATQSAATDPTTGTIDMDLITTGRSAQQRTMAQHLAAVMLEKFRHMSKQTLPVAEIQKGIATDTGMEVGAGELREALLSLERDGYVRFTRPNVISIV
jgi:DNA replication licensing factor MCM4